MNMLRYLVFIIFLWGSQLNAQSLETRLENHVTYLADTLTEGRGLGTKGKIIAEQYIEKEFKNIGLMPWKGSYRHEFKFRTGLVWVDATNFIGVIPGNDPNLKNEYIVVGAHYDHLGYKLESKNKTYFPGADDNASGVASIIEMARLIDTQKNKLKRSVIIVAFDAEESGLIGANNFVDDEVVPLSSIKAMFSLDMVGMYSTHGGVDLKGIETLIDYANLIEPLASEKNIKVKTKTAEIEQRTDTAPFGSKGIPAIHVFTGLKSPYHKPGDVAHLLDYKGMAQITEFMTSLVVNMSMAPSLDAKKSLTTIAKTGEPLYKRFDIGLIVGLGNNHHAYKDRFFDANGAFSYKGGIFMEWHWNKLSSLATSIQYDVNKSKIENGIFERHSITVPLNYVVSTPSKESGFRPYVAVGPYYRHNFSAKDNIINYEVPTDINESEWGYNWELGFEAKKFRFGWTNTRALTDVFTNDGNRGRIRANGNQFFLGYRF